MAQRTSGCGRHALTVEIAGSNPAWVTRRVGVHWRAKLVVTQRSTDCGGSTPSRSTRTNSQVVKLVYTRRSERRAHCGVGVRISPWLLTRVSQRSAGPHKPGPSGATPEPAMTRYANWQSGEVESLVFVGSTPTLVTFDRVVQRLRRSPRRQVMVQFHPRSLDNDRSVSVAAARARGKDEDRVQFPDGPLLKTWAARPTGRCLACNQEIGVRFPGRSTKRNGLMVQRDDTALAWRRSGFDSRWVH